MGRGAVFGAFVRLNEALKALAEAFLSTGLRFTTAMERSFKEERHE